MVDAPGPAGGGRGDRPDAHRLSHCRLEHAGDVLRGDEALRADPALAGAEPDDLVLHRCANLSAVRQSGIDRLRIPGGTARSCSQEWGPRAALRSAAGDLDGGAHGSLVPHRRVVRIASAVGRVSAAADAGGDDRLAALARAAWPGDAGAVVRAGGTVDHHRSALDTARRARVGVPLDAGAILHLAAGARYNDDAGSEPPMNDLPPILLILIPLAYVIGAIPFGLIVGKMRGIDVRTAGSGNIGAT